MCIRDSKRSGPRFRPRNVRCKILVVIVGSAGGREYRIAAREDLEDQVKISFFKEGKIGIHIKKSVDFWWCGG